MKPTICKCGTCTEIHKKINERTKYPECPYCKKHHNPALACPEYVMHIGQKSLDKKSPHPTCDLCGHKHDKRVRCIEFALERKNDEPNMGDLINDVSTGPFKPGDHAKLDKPRRTGPALPSDFEESCEYFLDIANGKYTVYQNKDGTFRAMRYSMDWQDLTGNNLVFNMMVELLDAKEKIKKSLEISNNDFIRPIWVNKIIAILKGEDNE